MPTERAPVAEMEEFLRKLVEQVVQASLAGDERAHLRILYGLAAEFRPDSPASPRFATVEASRWASTYLREAAEGCEEAAAKELEGLASALTPLRCDFCGQERISEISRCPNAAICHRCVEVAVLLLDCGESLGALAGYEAFEVLPKSAFLRCDLCGWTTGPPGGVRFVEVNEVRFCESCLRSMLGLRFDVFPGDPGSRGMEGG